MSIIFLGEMPGTSNRANGKRTAERIFRYSIEDQTVTDPSALPFEPEIPDTNTPHPTLTGMGANGVTFSQISGEFKLGVFDVKVTYQDSNSTGDVVNTFEDLPWNQPPFNLSFSSLEVVIPQEYAYDPEDEQFKPSIPLVHPATKEPVISDTIENHGIISFSFNLQKFDYGWKKILENTVNKEPETIIGYPFPAQTILLRKVGARKKNFTTSSGNIRYYWQIDIELEDFGKVIEKLLALQGYLAIFTVGENSLTRRIQLQDGIFGWYDNSELNIDSPRWVDKSGQVLQTGDAVYDEFYQSFPDKFASSWKRLDLPRAEV